MFFTTDVEPDLSCQHFISCWTVRVRSEEYTSAGRIKAVTKLVGI